MERMEVRNELITGFLAGPIVDSRWEEAWFVGGLEPGIRWELQTQPPVSICADCGSQSAGGGACPPSGHPQGCPAPSAACPPPAPGKKTMAYLF